ncbi:fatty acid desaturase [Sulfitobacter sp. EhC04]|uniref:fatty acid desaturase n=1 Tax=Sulfitobacter sp. EhC04 TaxID=1849168 RepID=UPI0009EE241E|nr:fatty acid desaturase [Sulfitobacter sp. EhC04]
MSTNASARHPVIIPKEKQTELYRLTNPPTIAWPTVAVLLYVMGGVIAVDIAALTGVIPLWLGMILNVATMYPFFHVMHDSFHRAASSNVKINDWIGRLVLIAVGFHVNLGAARYSHMMHHRFVNGPNDPDHYFHGKWWTLPFRWMTMDYHYTWYNLTREDPRGRKVMIKTLPWSITMFGIYAVLIYMGYGWELLLLWYMPLRLALGLISFAVLWLPHIDGDEHGELAHIGAGTHVATTGDTLTAATTMRLGFEKILAPLLQWHNYHLIHHLWPTTPSYNHAKVWALLEPELRERDLRIQHDFDLIPVLHHGRASAVPAE